jgi:hypothetical protein
MQKCSQKWESEEHKWQVSPIIPLGDTNMGWTNQKQRTEYMKLRFEQGLCRECQEPHEPGKLRCAKHLKLSSDEGKKHYRKNAKAIRDYAREWQRAKRRADPDAARAYQRERYRNFPDKFRGYELKQHYGISLAEYNMLNEKQNGLCALCGKPPLVGKKGRAHAEKRTPLLYVDHDHATGQVRGLLCHWCNSGINILAESDDSGDDRDRWLPRGLEFLSGLPTEKRKRRVILVMQAFLDESGVKGTHPIFTFAGFIGRAERWAEFSAKWVRWLQAEPRIEYLKMNEAVKLKGQFQSFTAEERNQKLRGGVAILKQYPQQAIQVSVDVADYQARLEEHQPKSIRDPYFLAFFGILSGVCYELIDTGVPEQIEIIFDEHSIFKPRINFWYPIVRDDIGVLHDPALANVLPPSPIFKDDFEFVPLQGADVLAWLFRNAYSGNINEFSWIAEELATLIPLSQYSTLYDAERMKNVLRLSDEMFNKITPEMIAAVKRDQPQWRTMMGKKANTRQREVASQFDNFDKTMRVLIKVPHAEIKAELDAEKKRKAKAPSASDRDADKTD